jgi:flagellar hook-associated protein 1 FlgK
MVGLFNILNMGGQSLSVQQDATAVAGQNLANVDNPNYSEQTLQIQSATPIETSIGDEGTGIEATGITQITSALLNSQIQSEASTSGSLTSQQNALDNIEAQLDEQINSTTTGTGDTSTSPDGLSQDLSNLFDSLQTLSTDPSSISNRQAVVQSAQAVTEQFNQVSTGIGTVTAGLNSSIQSDVAGVNQDLTQIAGLNLQIMQAQGSGGSANDLLDQREKIVEDLASKVNATTSTAPNGTLYVSIGGQQMLSGGAVTNGLQTYTDSNGNLLVQDQTTGTPLTLTGGSIEGSITARDGTMSSLSTSLNTLASQIISQVNTVYSAGYDLNGNTGQNFFTGTNASDIGVNSTVVNDPSTFQASGTAGASGNNTVALSLAQLADQPVTGLNNQTISQNYATTIGAFGSSLQSVNEQLTNSGAVSQMLTTQRASLTGVDSDTEMTNLLQFQKAYEASAELVTTVNAMLETTINMKTE